MTALPSRFVSAPLLRACAFGALALVLAAIPTHLRPTPFNNYVILADAFLHGHVWITMSNPKVDAVTFGGRFYVVNDPVPALLLLPYVAIAGLAANQTLLGGLLAFVAAAAAWRIAENLAVPVPRAIVICAFMFAGTDLWWTAVLGDVWFLAQTSAVAFALLALMELSGSRPRGWLVALYYVLAVGSRFTLAMGLPALAYLVYAGNLDVYRANRAGGRGRLVAFGAVVAGYATLWTAYNYVRWGVAWDAGHTVFFHEDVAAGAAVGSPFGLQNLRYQIVSFFITLPPLTTHFPYVRTVFLRGTALTWTSPALLFAIWARQPWQTVRTMWIAAILVAAPSFLYYVNGYTQYGMRHALDFEPFLFVLMLLAARDRLPRSVTALVIYSIAATTYGVWIWATFIVPSR